MRFAIAVAGKHILLILAGSFLLLAPGSLPAQGPGRLRGQVTDPSGAVIPGADITVQPAQGQAITSKSDGFGSYDIKSLPPGNYTVTVTAKGFVSVTKPIAVAAGQDTKLDLPLQIATKEEEVVVESEGAKVSVNPENNSSALVISGKDLDALSDDPDELQSELQALAGPSAGPNGGQIYIDGFTGGQLPPKSSIREIRINQNPFSAQYDRMGFGRIEVLTKPGTDQLHGQIFYNDNHSIFDALNPFVARDPTTNQPIEPDFSSEIVNANLGGPLNKRSSYFLNFQRRNIEDAAIILGSAFSAANIAPSPVLNPRIRTNTGARLDYQLTDSNTLTARYQYTQDHQENNGVSGLALPSLAYNQDLTEHTFQLSDTQTLSPRAVNETRFEYERTSTGQNSLSNLPEENVQGIFTNGGNPIGVSSVVDDHYELQNYSSWNKGNHFMRFGGRLRATKESNFSTQNFNGTFVVTGAVNSTGQLVNPIPKQFTVTTATGNRSLSNTFVDTGIYAEDDWKFRPNATLSYGLRFETQNGIQDHGDWAPRLGLAWGLGKKNGPPKTVIRTGFGIFYDRFGQNFLVQAERFNGANQQQFTVTDPATLSALFSQLPGPIKLPSTLQGTTATTMIPSQLRAPYTVQAAASVERQLTKASTLTLTYLHSLGVHQLFAINDNPPPPGAPTTTVGAPVYKFVSEGAFNQNQLITQFNMRAGARVTLFSYYVLSYANSNVSSATTGAYSPAAPGLSFPSMGTTLAADYGRAAYDIRNRVFFGGSIALPQGFRVSPFIVYNSAAPFDITTGTDLNGDSVFNDRPAFASLAPGASAPDCAHATPTAPVCSVPGFAAFNLFPGNNVPRIPVNFGEGASQFTANLRLSKTFGLGPKVETAAGNGQQGGGRGPGGGGRGPMFPGGGGREGGRGGQAGGPGGMFGERSNQRYSLTFSVNARNLFNNVNPALPVGNLNSPSFGKFVGLSSSGLFNTQSANRRLDFQAMFSF